MEREFTVLGIMGAANSGKDFVADWFVENHGFVKVSFADVMKRFALRVFDYSTEQLWGPSDMRNETHPTTKAEWQEWEANLKQYAVRFAQGMEFGSVIKEGLFLKALHQWFLKLTLEYLEKPISPRIVLQLLGTEMGRNFDENLWVNYAYNVVIPKLKDQDARSSWHYDKRQGLTGQVGQRAEGVVIADHRFKNEVRETQSRGGYVIRVRRLSKEGSDSSVGLQGHASEAEMKEIPESALNLTLKLHDGKEKAYPVLETAYRTKLWKEGLGLVLGP